MLFNILKVNNILTAGKKSLHWTCTIFCPFMISTECIFYTSSIEIRFHSTFPLQCQNTSMLHRVNWQSSFRGQKNVDLDKGINQKNQKSIKCFSIDGNVGGWCLRQCRRKPNKAAEMKLLNVNSSHFYSFLNCAKHKYHN